MIKTNKNLKNIEDLQKALLDSNNSEYFCALHQTYTIMGNRWTLMILGSLIHGKKRNSELQREIDGISPKMLSQTLKKLILYKMVKRKVYPEVPPRVEYWLTDFGKSTADPVMALLRWTMDWKDELRALDNVDV
ncbi:helix-turn-helix domain-containing protein [Pedobacter sp. UYP30]|uniref:winged helix-turn-helix transcriptional regulator n=1 Tax=Pedobacter sp. UYP30 TaxID=1756400 RepID=UPI0033920B84